MKEETLPQMIALLESLEKTFHGNLADMKYHLETANSIWQLADFQVGDRVYLKRTPEITEKAAWGWLGAKHFLIKDALATVHHREFSNAVFKYGLHFDEDSYLDLGGIKHLNTNKGIYMFEERWLERVS